MTAFPLKNDNSITCEPEGSRNIMRTCRQATPSPTPVHMQEDQAEGAKSGSTTRKRAMTKTSYREGPRGTATNGGRS